MVAAEDHAAVVIYNDRFRDIDLGKHPYVPLPPYEGLEVRKRGFVTETTIGTVAEVDLTVVITDFNGQSVRIGGVGSRLRRASWPGLRTIPQSRSGGVRL